MSLTFFFFSYTANAKHWPRIHPTSIILLFFITLYFFSCGIALINPRHIPISYEKLYNWKCLNNWNIVTLLLLLANIVLIISKLRILDIVVCSYVYYMSVFHITNNIMYVCVCINNWNSNANEQKFFKLNFHSLAYELVYERIIIVYCKV